MRIVQILTINKFQRSLLEKGFPGLYAMPFADFQRIYYQEDYLAGCWVEALAKLGYETLVLPLNYPELHAAWAREQGLNIEDIEELILRQMEAFKPDILLYNHYLARTLLKIKDRIRNLRLTLCYANTVIYDTEVFKHAQGVISCSVDIIQQQIGDSMPSQIIHHAFNPRILTKLSPVSPESKKELVFIGSVIRKDGFHYIREQILLELLKKTPLKIYSTTFDIGTREVIMTFIRQVAYVLATPLRMIPPLYRAIGKLRYAERLLTLDTFPRLPYHPGLKRAIYPPVFGTEMFQQLSEGLVGLNVHPDLAPRFASNMRLFETTGVGTCLLTDWRENMHELFEDGKEVVNFKTIPECVEKAQYLMDHPDEARAIGAAGQARALQDHTYENRAMVLDGFLKRLMK
jgi:spore maturation protein CgeB